MSTQLSGRHYKYASIDAAPPEAGFWSEAISVPKSQGVLGLVFSRRGGGVATPIIQFKTAEEGADWTDYLTDEDLSNGARLRLDELGTGVQWRAGVKNGAYSSGTVIVGFDW